MPTKKVSFLPSKSTTESLLQWGIVSFLLALTPMIFAYLWMALTKKPLAPGFDGFVRAVSPRGELLIVAVALLGEGSSDMFKRSRNKNLNLLLGGLCLIPLLISAFCYAAIQTAATSQPMDQNLIFRLSLGFFGYSVCMGLACKCFGKN